MLLRRSLCSFKTDEESAAVAAKDALVRINGREYHSLTVNLLRASSQQLPSRHPHSTLNTWRMSWFYRRLIRSVLFTQTPEQIHERTLRGLAWWAASSGLWLP